MWCFDELSKHSFDQKRDKKYFLILHDCESQIILENEEQEFFESMFILALLRILPIWQIIVKPSNITEE